MTRRLRAAFLMLLTLTIPALLLAADEPDELIPAKIFIVKTGKLAKFVAKPSSGEFALPDASLNDPTIEGATVRFFDTVPGGAGDLTYTLPASGWTALGPGGSKGYKFKGTAGTCKVVILKPKVIKAVCKDAMTLTTPFAGPAGVILTAGTDSKRYCMVFGGEEKKNDAKLTKRKGAPAPAMCPEVAPTPTATNTGTVTSTATVTNTPVDTATATATATVTDTPVATATATITATPTATNTVPACALSAGSYTTTQVAGGTLQVYSFAPFAFPVGGTIVQDVAAASPPNCVHTTVVPFPGGFNAPTFCVQALMFTTQVNQIACGVGRIDSNGGSDFNISTIADTSDNTVCALPNTPCSNGINKGIRVDVTVGNGVADTCSNGGTANAAVTVPVHTTSWVDNSGGTFMGCQGNGVFNPGDMVAAEFDQFLDFTTDTATGKWMDLNGDGCTIAGFGPAAGFTASGATETKCIDIGLGTVTVGASGQFGATGGLFDGSFKTVLPSSFTGPGAPLGASCGSPPVINFAGSATRCIP